MVIYTVLVIIFVLGEMGIVQYCLGKRKNKYVGLIIPTIILLVSIIVSLYFIIPIREKYTVSSSGETYTCYSQEEADKKYEEYISENDEAKIIQTIPKESNLGKGIEYFLLLNIVTSIYLVIYYFSRKIYKESSENLTLQI